MKRHIIQDVFPGETLATVGVWVGFTLVTKAAGTLWQPLTWLFAAVGVQAGRAIWVGKGALVFKPCPSTSELLIRESRMFLVTLLLVPFRAFYGLISLRLFCDHALLVLSGEAAALAALGSLRALWLRALGPRFLRMPRADALLPTAARLLLFLRPLSRCRLHVASRAGSPATLLCPDDLLLCSAPFVEPVVEGRAHLAAASAGMDEAALEELCNSLTSLRTQKDWRNKLQSCEQVATQLLNMPDRSDSQFDKLVATTINYLLLAQSTADVDTRLHAEEVRRC